MNKIGSAQLLGYVRAWYKERTGRYPDFEMSQLIMFQLISGKPVIIVRTPNAKAS